MNIWRIIFSIFLIIFAQTLFAQTLIAQSVPTVKVNMRDSGYTIGDFIHMQVEITLPGNQQLDSESLPLAGRIKPWLDLHALNMRTKNNKIHLDLTWQIFATVEIAQPLKTPEIILKTLGKEPQSISIPAQNFYYSPVLAYPLGDVTRRADLPPLKFDERTPRMWAFTLLGLALLSGLLWLWLKDLLPWWPHRPGPITKLARHLKRCPASKAGSGSQADGFDIDGLNVDNLRRIHHALNASAGESLYPHTLQKLFVQAPYLESEKTAISAFFYRSWQNFYAPQSFRNNAERNDDEKVVEIDPKATLAWIQNAALAERLFRRQPARTNRV